MLYGFGMVKMVLFITTLVIGGGVFWYTHSSDFSWKEEKTEKGIAENRSEQGDSNDVPGNVESSADSSQGLSTVDDGVLSGKTLQVSSSDLILDKNLAGITFLGSNKMNTGNIFSVSNLGSFNASTSFFVDHQATGSSNLALRVDDESGDITPFVVDGSGNVGIGTASPKRALDIFRTSSSPQLRLSQDPSSYSEFTTNAVGDLKIDTTGGDIKALSESLWICDNDACPSVTMGGEGNVLIENTLKFGNGIYMKNKSETELGVYDSSDNVLIRILDEDDEE